MWQKKDKKGMTLISSKHLTNRNRFGGNIIIFEYTFDGPTIFIVERHVYGVIKMDIYIP